MKSPDTHLPTFVPDFGMSSGYHLALERDPIRHIRLISEASYLEDDPLRQLPLNNVKMQQAAAFQVGHDPNSRGRGLRGGHCVYL